MGIIVAAITLTPALSHDGRGGMLVDRIVRRIFETGYWA